MPKTIPAMLLAHKALPATTLCALMKVGPLPSGAYIAMTSLDRDVTYDDGTGALVYRASTGMQLSTLSSTNDLSVDNAETQSLAPVYPVEGVTVAMVDNGDLDGCEMTAYQVNYADLSMGHEILFNGPIGEVRIVEGGLITFENRSWSQLLKQNSVCELDSLTCRVKRFGSQIGDERFPCKYSIAGEWVDGEVTAVGTETVREFTDSALAQAADYFAPGLVEWLTGSNAGQHREIEGFGAGAVTLQFTTRHPITVGDTFRIRRDCSRQWSGHNSCETYGNRPNFRGEPFIPVADTTGLFVPGAAAAGGSGISGAPAYGALE